uniref:Uncharacterized protein n=1 Tax=Timema monikensis TaxID=170555 RepID=A0A7R9HNC1_9NEOP|nr:unnamed protein product [Timema monikensis]
MTWFGFDVGSANKTAFHTDHVHMQNIYGISRWNMEANKVDSIHQEAFLPFTQLEDFCLQDGTKHTSTNLSAAINKTKLEYKEPHTKNATLRDFHGSSLTSVNFSRTKPKLADTRTMTEQPGLGKKQQKRHGHEETTHSTTGQKIHKHTFQWKTGNIGGQLPKLSILSRFGSDAGFTSSDLTLNITIHVFQKECPPTGDP